MDKLYFIWTYFHRWSLGEWKNSSSIGLLLWLPLDFFFDCCFPFKRVIETSHLIVPIISGLALGCLGWKPLWSQSLRLIALSLICSSPPKACGSPVIVSWLLCFTNLFWALFFLLSLEFIWAACVPFGSDTVGKNLFLDPFIAKAKQNVDPSLSQVLSWSIQRTRKVVWFSLFCYLLSVYCASLLLFRDIYFIEYFLYHFCTHFGMVI